RQADEPHYLASTLVGAYQQLIGHNHNLHGTPNEAQIHIAEEGYLIKKVIRGTTVGEAVGRARYDRGLLHDGFRRQVAQRIKDGDLTEAEGSDLVNFYESRFDAYTYVSVNGNQIKGRRRHDY